MRKITLSELLKAPLGTSVGGLAPIGVQWAGVVSRRRDGTRYVRPNKGCPVGEFAACTATIYGERVEIVEAVQWWQGRIASPHWDLAALNAKLQARYPGAPAITGITERVLFAPLRGVYLCEGQPSMWQEHLDYDATFEADIEEQWDAVREYVDGLLMDEPNEDGGQYVHTRSVWDVDRNAPIEGKWVAVHNMGAFQSDSGDGDNGQGYYGAREQAQGNHYI
jgi:hypothetical protein